MQNLLKRVRDEKDILNQYVGKDILKLISILDSYVSLSYNPNADWKFSSMFISLRYVDARGINNESAEDYECVDSRKIVQMIEDASKRNLSYVTGITVFLLGSILVKVNMETISGFISVSTEAGLDASKEFMVLTNQNLREVKEYVKSQNLRPYEIYCVDGSALNTLDYAIQKVELWYVDPNTDSPDLNVLDELNYVFQSKYLKENIKQQPYVVELYSLWLKLYNKHVMTDDAYMREFLYWCFQWTDYTCIDIQGAFALSTLLRRLVEVFGSRISVAEIIVAFNDFKLNGNKIVEESKIRLLLPQM